MTDSDSLVKMLFDGPKYAVRRGATYGLAGAIKGLRARGDGMMWSSCARALHLRMRCGSLALGSVGLACPPWSASATVHVHSSRGHQDENTRSRGQPPQLPGERLKDDSRCPAASDTHHRAPYPIIQPCSLHCPSSHPRPRPPLMKSSMTLKTLTRSDPSIDLPAFTCKARHFRSFHRHHFQHATG
ncbi:hypothetical protein OG21DRAFT_269744 [Imleria badia]|nr:hypothetical protein OG21DRAFT_269744 [Imleria badia]